MSRVADGLWEASRESAGGGGLSLGADSGQASGSWNAGPSGPRAVRLAGAGLGGGACKGWRRERSRTGDRRWAQASVTVTFLCSEAYWGITSGGKAEELARALRPSGRAWALPGLLPPHTKVGRSRKGLPGGLLCVAAGIPLCQQGSRGQRRRRGCTALVVSLALGLLGEVRGQLVVTSGRVALSWKPSGQG